MILSSHSVGIFSKWMISSIRSRICWAPSTPEAFSISATIRNVPAALPHYISLMSLTTSSSGMWGPGLSRDRLLWRSLGPSETLIVFFPCSLLGPVIQAELTSIIVDRFLTLDIQVFASYLVGEAEKVSAAGWRVFEDFLFSLGFCQIDSMFGEVLGLLIFLLAATSLPGFPASPLSLTAMSTAAFHHQAPVPLRLFSNVMILHWHNLNVNKMSTLLKLHPTNTSDIVLTFSLGNRCIQMFHWTRLFSDTLLL